MNSTAVKRRLAERLSNASVAIDPGLTATILADVTELSEKLHAQTTSLLADGDHPDLQAELAAISVALFQLQRKWEALKDAVGDRQIWE
jgi:hypothetical protein